METQGKTKDLMQKFGNIGHVVYKTKEGDFEIYCRLSAESVLITAHEVPQLVEFLLDGLSIEDKSKIISKPKTYSEKLAQVKIGDVLIRAVPDENGRNTVMDARVTFISETTIGCEFFFGNYYIAKYSRKTGEDLLGKTYGHLEFKE